MRMASTGSTGIPRKLFGSSMGCLSPMQGLEAMYFPGVGSGSGEDEIYASQLFRSATGIDISSHAIDLAMEKCTTCHSRNGNHLREKLTGY